ncbi:MAG TPA: hypothetical protein VFV64_01470 [Permianibacter sp.]|nr:hypothetical protein [Permianibacter sp.]
MIAPPFDRSGWGWSVVKGQSSDANYYRLAAGKVPQTIASFDVIFLLSASNDDRDAAVDSHIAKLFPRRLRRVCQNAAHKRIDVDATGRIGDAPVTAERERTGDVGHAIGMPLLATWRLPD